MNYLEQQQEFYRAFDSIPQILMWITIGIILFKLIKSKVIFKAIAYIVLLLACSLLELAIALRH